MTKKELKKALRELHRINIMISKDLNFYNKEVDRFFNSQATNESENVIDNEVKEKSCKLKSLPKETREYRNTNNGIVWKNK